MIEQKFIEAWKTILADTKYPWVLFKHGTCVVVKNPGEDIVQQAKDFLKKWGYAPPGTPQADFSADKLPDLPGYLVTTGGPEEIATYVDETEIKEKYDELMIGILGKAKRKHDTRDLEVIYIENKENHL
jgi:hypothetical protein